MKNFLTASAVPRIPPANGHVPNKPKIKLRWLSVTQAPRPLFAAAQHNDWKNFMRKRFKTLYKGVFFFTWNAPLKKSNNRKSR